MIVITNLTNAKFIKTALFFGTMQFEYISSFRGDSVKKTIIVPAQINRSLEVFHAELCKYAENSPPKTFCCMGIPDQTFTYVMNYRLWMPEEPSLLRTRIEYKHFIPQLEIVKKFLGPKGIEISVMFTSDNATQGYALLEDMLAKISITACGEKGVLLVKSYGDVLNWYLGEYKKVNEIGKQIDQMFDEKSSKEN